MSCEVELLLMLLLHYAVFLFLLRILNGTSVFAATSDLLFLLISFPFNDFYK